jgi:ribosomal peptide maturation radical SAM protein 1
MLRRRAQIAAKKPSQCTAICGKVKPAPILPLHPALPWKNTNGLTSHALWFYMRQRHPRPELPMSPAHALLIVPPFASSHWPALGLHVLQSVARQQGLQVDILYANLLLAGLLGEDNYEAICDYPQGESLGERIMAWFLFDGEPALPALSDLPLQGIASPTALRQILCDWRAQVVARLAQHPARVIGVSSMFDQTHAARIILAACRSVHPDRILVMGGANCDRGMSEAMAEYVADADHVFSGESEQVFADFLRNPEAFAGQKVIRSEPNAAVGQLPPNDFAQFIAQHDEFLPNSTRRAQRELAYESSRGCWWGQKHHCTFCGLNRDGIGFREKDPDQVFDELVALHREQGASRILMSDFIMPNRFYHTLLPRLAQAQLDLRLFYEIKANIDLPRAMLLQQAGVDRIQPGIEGLHSESLKLMRKGVRGKQNIALLRYARALNMQVLWNFLYGFPGEQVAWFAEVLAILPLLEHLMPPQGMLPISIDRFSPYFTDTAGHGLSNLRPYPAFAEIFARHPAPGQLAYHFCADSAQTSLHGSALLPPFQQAIANWQASWRDSAQQPALIVLELSNSDYLLLDSRRARRIDGPLRLSRAQAAACLVELPQPNQDTEWACAHGLALQFDGAILPLAVAEARVLQCFEAEYARQRIEIKPITAQLSAK